jgi:hypothetical protein
LPKLATPIAILLSVGAAVTAWGQVRLGSEFQVNSYTANFRPTVASHSGGRFVVVWTGSQDGGLDGFGVFGQRYDASGVPEGPGFPVNSYTTGGQYVWGAAFASGGELVVTWWSVGQDGSGRGVFAQRYDASGTPQGGEFQVNSYTFGDQALPTVDWAVNDTFLAIWGSDSQDGSGAGVFGQRYDASGATLGAEFQVNSYPTSHQGAARVAATASGGFVVVWQSAGQDGSGNGIFGTRYDASGASEGTEFQVNSYTTYHQGEPAVASDANGNLVVVWSDGSGQDGGSEGVFGQRYDGTGMRLGGEFRVNAYTTSTQRSPAIASDASGDFVAVWESFRDSAHGDLFGRRFDGSGLPQGDEFRVNFYTTAIERAPRVSSDADGSFVVVWSSYALDNTPMGAFGQRFAPDAIFTNGFESGD